MLLLHHLSEEWKHNVPGELDQANPHPVIGLTGQTSYFATSNARFGREADRDVCPHFDEVSKAIFSHRLRLDGNHPTTK